MKKFVLLFSLLILFGCGPTGPTLQKQIATIDDIEKEIYSSSTTLNLTNEDYMVLQTEVKEKDADLIFKKRYGLYTKLMSSFLDPEISLEIKNKIIIFFQNVIDSPIYSSIRAEELNDKKYLKLSSFISASLFDTETKILFYRELASLKGLTSGLGDEFYLKHQLCNAVEDNELVYASVLIDLSVGRFDPGEIRCIDGGKGMEVFTGSTLGMKSDLDVISKLGVCPMSLRRISGRNYGRAVVSRLNSWGSNLRKIDRDSIKSLDDAKEKIKRTFTNIPPINPVPGSMNSLLDEYNNTWLPGGDCSLKSK